MSSPPSETAATKAPIRVALVEDDLGFQAALRDALADVPDIALGPLAANRQQGLALLAGAPADVLLVDLGLPDGSGVDVIRAARSCWPTCAAMVCSVFGDEAHVMRAIEAGASGYLLKDCPPDSVAEQIRTLHAGGSPISPIIARKVLMRFQDEAAPRAGAPLLSGRESQVLGLITKGFTAEEIGALLGVSRHTVLSYVRRIYAKLEVSSKAEAIFEARALGLIAS